MSRQVSPLFYKNLIIQRRDEEWSNEGPVLTFSIELLHQLSTNSWHRGLQRDQLDNCNTHVCQIVHALEFWMMRIPILACISDECILFLHPHKTTCNESRKLTLLMVSSITKSFDTVD